MSFPIFDLLAKRAELGPERVALEDLGNGQRLTYRQLDVRASRAAALLHGLGIAPGARVAVLCRNRVEFFELLFACARLGAILVPLNWRMPVAELAPLLEDCGAKLLLHGSEDEQLAKLLVRQPVQRLALDAPGAAGYPCRRDRCAPLTGRSGWDADEPWYLLYTSGTTGRPKAVIQTYTMAMANYINISQAMGLRADDTTLNYLPLFHTGGINLVTLPALIMGSKVLVMPGFDLEQMVELLAVGQLDTFFGVPAIYQALSLHPRFGELDLTRVRCWGCGGAPLPEILLEQFAERGALILNGMGMTETGPTVFLMDAPYARLKAGSVGKPQILSAVRLVGTDGNEVKQGEPGELWFAGAGVTPGYFRQPDATAGALVDGTWLRSGDIGRQDEDGYYYIVGRLKDMYVSGAENVFPAEVEKQLLEHPDVMEAAVVGVADDKWGEVGCAYLLARPGHTLPPTVALQEFCRRTLAAYKVPKYFVAVDSFPRTAAGKIQKHLLVKEASEA